MAASQSFDEYLGPWWDEAHVLTAMRTTATDLAKLRTQRRLIGIQFNDGRYYYPTRQFAHTQPVTLLPGLGQVIAILAAAIDDPETWATWLAGEHESGVTNYAALRSGHRQNVFALARHDSDSWAN